GLNILNLRKIVGTDPRKPPSFFDHPWYLEEPFAQQDCEPGWHFLCTNVLPDSVSQPIHYISSLRDSGLELPSAIEVVLMLFLHFAGTGEQLLQRKHTWCRDQASLDRFVTVGAFGRNGLFLSAHPGMYASRGLGICAKLMRLPCGALSGRPEFESEPVPVLRVRARSPRPRRRARCALRHAVLRAWHDRDRSRVRVPLSRQGCERDSAELQRIPKQRRGKTIDRPYDKRLLQPSVRKRAVRAQVARQNNPPNPGSVARRRLHQRQRVRE